MPAPHTSKPIRSATRGGEKSRKCLERNKDTADAFPSSAQRLSPPSHARSVPGFFGVVMLSGSTAHTCAPCGRPAVGCGFRDVPHGFGGATAGGVCRLFVRWQSYNYQMDFFCQEFYYKWIYFYQGSAPFWNKKADLGSPYGRKKPLGGGAGIESGLKF